MGRESLRVGIDGKAFTSPAGGVRRYVTELFRALRTLHAEVKLVLIGASADARLPVDLCHRAARFRRGEPCAGSVQERALCSQPPVSLARRPLMLPIVCEWQETRSVEPRVGPGESPVCRPGNVSRNHVFYRSGRS
jgi:hypothetical protein